MKKRTGKTLIDFWAPALFVKKILVKVGHPFYHFLLLIIFIPQLIFFVGEALLGIILRSLKKEEKNLSKKLKRIVKKITFPKVSISLPKIYFPKPLLRLPKPPSIKIKIPFIRMGILFIIIACLSTVGFLLFDTLKDLPSPQNLSSRNQILTTKIYDRNGKLLYKIYREKDRTQIKLSQLPKHVIQATIAIEDKDFYKHPGISIKGIIRAVYQNVFKKKKTGGSTITQQLVKNVLLTPEKTWQRKVKEIVLALIVEKTYSKDEILEMYLNEVGYGGAVYGIEEASQKYFGKSAKDLGLAEAAFLAGLPASPTLYSSFNDNQKATKTRQALVLKRMTEDDYISQSQSELAQSQELKFISPKAEILAPHFVMYIKDILTQKYGEKLVEQGGLEIKTTLDLDLQETAQKIVFEEIKHLSNLRVSNGAALITNPRTGEILAMVGSKDYFAKDIDGNFNVTTSLRQPGSSIKPVNYSVALENGFTLATLIDDSPITYKVANQPPYSPINYDRQFHGQIPLRIALGSSYNVPAVKILAAFGVQKMIDQGRKMGITTWNDPSQYGLSLTLGGGEVKMTDMAVVYGVLANNGIKIDLNPILEIKDRKGKILEKFTIKETKAISPPVAFLLTNILADNSSRTPAFGSNSQLFIPGREVAVKTGTTQNLRDNWTIGFTPSRLAAVWVGNNDNTPMSYVASGITGASPIWRKIMDKLLENQPAEYFSKPEEIIEVEICTLTNTLTCEGCPTTKKESFLTGTEPKISCDPEKIKEILEKKPKPTSSPQIL